MMIRDESIAELFSLSRDAVIGIVKGNIAFANSAACALFPLRIGESASGILPAWALEQEGEHFIFSHRYGERVYAVSGVRKDELLLLTLTAEKEESSAVPSGVLSELRQSAYNLKMAAELLAEKNTRDAKCENYAAIMRKNYFSLTRLIRNIGDIDALSRSELTVSREATDLHRLCAELMDSVAFFLKSREINIEFHALPGHYCMKADRERIETLILNLICNSALHTDKGGTILLSLAERDDRILLSLDDNGHGIPAERLSTLFSFRSASLQDANSAGLGLMLCESIVRLHGGTLLVRSEPEKGTHIRIMLPQEKKLTLRDDLPLAPGAGRILLELSPVLPSSMYSTRYTD